MNRLPVQVWGPSYRDRSLPFAAQSTINLFPGLPTGDGRGVRAMYNWYGHKSFLTASGSDRGMGVMSGVLYKLSGDTLYSVSSAGVATSLGTIPGGGRVNMSNDGVNLIISTGTARYQYNGTALTKITDPDHTPGNTSTFINSQIVMDGAGATFQIAEVNDPDSINALNYASAESAPGDTQAVYAFRSYVHVFSSNHKELWYNDGSSDFPPFSRDDNASHPVGIGAVHSISNDDRFVYFLSNDGDVYRAIDIGIERITPLAMSSYLETADLASAWGECIKIADQWFYVLTFFDKTWVIPAIDPSNTFQLSTGLSRARYSMNSYVFVYGKHLIGDYRNGNIYELDPQTFGQGSDDYMIERAFGPINAESLGLPGHEVTMNRFEFIMETGVGNADDTDPVAIVDISFDGGRSFTNEKWVQLGQAGERKMVTLDIKRTFKDAVPRIRCTAPVQVSLHSAAIHGRLSGKNK